MDNPVEKVIGWLIMAIFQDMAIYWLLHRLANHHLTPLAAQGFALLLGVTAGLLMAAVAMWTPRWRGSLHRHVAAAWRIAVWFGLTLAATMMLAIEPTVGGMAWALIVATGVPYLEREIRRATGDWLTRRRQDRPRVRRARRVPLPDDYQPRRPVPVGPGHPHEVGDGV